MDPDATYRDLLDAIEIGDTETAEQLASDLLRWIATGGFAPVVETRLAGMSRFQSVLATSLCRAVLEPSLCPLPQRSQS